MFSVPPINAVVSIHAPLQFWSKWLKRLSCECVLAKLTLSWLSVAIALIMQGSVKRGVSKQQLQPAAHVGTDVDGLENKGVLWGKSLEEAKSEGINLTGEALDIKYLFGDLEGSALLEQIFKFWCDGECDVPWFYSDGANGPDGHGLRKFD